MIPVNAITEWQAFAPWLEYAQIEQDLVLSRALVELFSSPDLVGQIAMRGGTVLHKLHIPGSHRYSEDIDLVRLQSGPVGPLMDLIQQQLNPWLGTPRREVGRYIHITYRFSSELPPHTPLRLKIEINTKEKNAFFGLQELPFQLVNSWFSGQANVCTFSLEELMATKFRALYQRKKGRDLFDLWLALCQPNIDPLRIIEGFHKYMSLENRAVSRKEFEDNLTEKLIDSNFQQDIIPLLPQGSSYNIQEASLFVIQNLVSLLP